VKNVWRWWLGVAAVGTSAYYMVPHSPESKLVLYNGLGLLSVVAIAFGRSRNRANPRTPWNWFAAGLLSFLIADICYYVLELTSPDGPPFPSIADFFYLSMYPLVIIGLTKMVRRVAPGRDTASFIDAAVVGIAMFGALWVLFVDTVFTVSQHSTSALVTTLAYPVMDVCLLAVAARLVVAVRLKHPPFALILLAIGSLAIADTAYGIYNASGNFHTGLFIDAFWLGFYTLFGAAALHPAVATTADEAHATEDRLTARQLTLMITATIGLPTIDLVWGTVEDRVVTIVSSALLFIFILIRVFALMRTIQRSQDRLRHDAEHDSLTGLSNRVRFAQRTGAALTREPTTAHVAVLFIDLDDFKTINDSLGHHAGDRLLAEVAGRLGRCIRPGDLVARLGGDEFAILLESAVDRQDAVSVARRVLDALAEPIDLGTRVVTISASIGIAMDPDAADGVEALLRNADVAMYLSKNQGKGRYEFFESRMHEEVIERLDLTGDLQLGLDGKQFVLHYQPIFDLETGDIALVEALVRWNHPTRGMIPPDRFIPLAEENGMIVPLGEWVLREACTQVRQWQQLGWDKLGVTVNLSMRQLADGQFVHTLTNALRDSGLKASDLLLEITESMLAHDAERSTGVLEQLKTVGVKLAIDDFGTGYSSLSYLSKFPVDSIKIDRSFINELHRSPTSTALVEAVLTLSKALGASTVAEGIEYDDQAELLQRLGCTRGQGYYFCRPLPASALGDLLSDHVADDAAPLESWRRTAEAIQHRSFEVEVRTGLDELRAVEAELVALTDQLDLPVMARWPWLETWALSFADWRPLMIGIRSTTTGALSAVALLATRERAGSTAIVALGHGSSLHTSLPALDQDAGLALADAVAKTLRTLPGTWSLDLEQLSDLDPTAQALARQLDHSQQLPELRVPRVVFATAHGIDMLLSKNMRKQLRRARGRIHDAGLEMAIAFDRGEAITAELIDDVERVHISRDRDARRQSDLDRPSEREFWRRVVEAEGRHWEVEIASLRLNGELAAYVVALLDGEVYRVFDGRMSSDFQDYSPGRLVEAAALARAMSDPRFAVLDWMSGIAAEKLLVTNMAEGRTRVVATSGSRFMGTPKRRNYRREPALTA
jgi:diguanylate cyclase (GGDEF)-like protein